jgi:hypothetical protein
MKDLLQAFKVFPMQSVDELEGMAYIRTQQTLLHTFDYMVVQKPILVGDVQWRDGWIPHQICAATTPNVFTRPMMMKESR